MAGAREGRNQAPGHRCIAFKFQGRETKSQGLLLLVHDEDWDHSAPAFLGFAERLTGTVAESYSNAAMQWGTDTEPMARSAYQFYTDADVVQTGFVLHPTIADAGASPDGLVGDEGLVEIKCPSTATHIDTLLSGTVPGKYLTQMLWQMACTGRQWCDLVSFDPRLPESMRLFVKRVERDDARIAELETEVVTFLSEVRDTVHRLRSKYEPGNADVPEVAKMLMAG